MQISRKEPELLYGNHAAPVLKAGGRECLSGQGLQLTIFWRATGDHSNVTKWLKFLRLFFICFKVR